MLSLILIFFECGSTNYSILLFYKFPFWKQIIIFLCFFITFSSKVPMFPFYLWLPEAHVEAPTSGSIILAALLLKLGIYGFFRFLVPVVFQAIYYFLPVIFLLIMCSIFYCSLIIIRSYDLKKIIAYSSIIHMNFCVFGVFSYTVQGLQGAFFLMLGHGIISSSLFFIIGILYDRYHTRVLYYYSGLSQVMPCFSMFFLIFSFANIAFPGTFNFISEFLILCGLVSISLLSGILFLFGFLLSVIYSIWTFSRVCFGVVQDNYFFFIDLTFREFSVLLILSFLVLFFGLLSPAVVLNTSYTAITYFFLFNNIILL